MTRSIDAPTLRADLLDGGEITLVDVREQGLYGANHLLLAINIPLSRLELDIRPMAPRLGTRVVLCDDSGGEAERAAEFLAAAGYSDISILDGGVGAWGAAGFELFSGVNVPSKLFGEYVEHHCDTPNITAEELKAKQDAGEDVVVLDSRPIEEYRKMNIPGGIDAPGAELAYRVRDLAPNPDTLVVVNCAGRTRSIIGAQSLINAGTPNKVMALKNGTMGWHLAGFELEHGADRLWGPVSDQALSWSTAATARVAERYGVETIDAAGLERWRAEAEDHTLYLIDVRFPEEYRAGHLPGSRSAPGGQLVQATDRYIATRGARVVLIDDTGVRATMTAHWLVQMGWTYVRVLEGGLDGHDLETGAHVPTAPEAAAVELATIAPAELQERLDAGTIAVVDVADSISHRDGHIPGAQWAIRSRLADAAGKLTKAEAYAIACPDAGLARLAGRDLAALTGAEVVLLEGGTAGWVEAGLPVEEGTDGALDEPVDRYYRAYDRKDGVEAAMNEYLDWEIELINQIERDGTLVFPAFPGP